MKGSGEKWTENGVNRNSIEGEIKKGGAKLPQGLTQTTIDRT